MLEDMKTSATFLVAVFPGRSEHIVYLVHILLYIYILYMYIPGILYLYILYIYVSTCASIYFSFVLKSELFSSRNPLSI